MTIQKIFLEFYHWITIQYRLIWYNDQQQKFLYSIQISIVIEPNSRKRNKINLFKYLISSL